ncbi:MAG TPA: cytochrome c-type biogenesis protein [Stellaceae bacterium]|nr:cytochrome c-type biogenesis protein [Stellaceae bacterium]
MRRRAFLLAALAAPLTARAVEPAEMLSDPKLEARARAIGRELRCLVCQNESIDDSGAGLAHDLRVLLRERIAAGDSDAQATQYIVNRYGQFVLLKPPVEPATWALWFGPPALLALAALGTVLFLRRRRPEAMGAPAPLDEAERQRIAQLLGEGDA